MIIGTFLIYLLYRHTMLLPMRTTATHPPPPVAQPPAAGTSNAGERPRPRSSTSDGAWAARRRTMPGTTNRLFLGNEDEGRMIGGGHFVAVIAIDLYAVKPCKLEQEQQLVLAVFLIPLRMHLFF